MKLFLLIIYFLLSFYWLFIIIYLFIVILINDIFNELLYKMPFIIPGTGQASKGEGRVQRHDVPLLLNNL